MKKKKRNRNKNPMAKELGKAQYRKRVIPNKKRQYEIECEKNYYRDFDEYLLG